MVVLKSFFNNIIRRSVFGFLWVALIGGCMVSPKQYLKIESVSFEEGSIVEGKTGQAVSFETMMSDLKGVQVIYVGE